MKKITIFATNKSLLIYIITGVLCLLPQSLWGQNDELLEELDNTLSRKQEIIQAKMNRIDSLRCLLKTDDSVKEFDIYQEIFLEYRVFQYDSAMCYVNRQQELAIEANDTFRLQQASINKAFALATGGYYRHASVTLDSLSTDGVKPELLFPFHFASYWLNVYSEGYCSYDVFSREYREKKVLHLRKALEYCPDTETALRNCLAGDYAYWAEHDEEKANVYYQKVTDEVPTTRRLYAMSAYALSQYYKRNGKFDLYEQWVLRAAISDQLSCTMGYMALQDYATALIEKDENNAERATRYIYQAINDARFYGNKLRVLDISEILPDIVSIYGTQLRESALVIKIGLVVLTSLLLVLILVLLKLRKEHRDTKASNQLICKQNEELERLNTCLQKQGDMREKYSQLLMDFCAMYINKFNSYRTLVNRKVKAKQADELLNTASFAKLTEHEAKVFNAEFDHAFLRLFPTFLDEFNKLLLDEERIELGHDGSFTTELRIFALIRLGVTESSTIATLLFYSPQTIYNYRTSMKRKARNKLTFEDDVWNLCRI